MYFLTAIVFIFIFSFLILIHELGHFAAAKRAGVKVEEFGFGLPPRIWGIKKGETLYSINWIPFGGFVRMLGEDGGSHDKRSFTNQSFWVQTKIVCAGVFMNLLMSFLLLTFGFLIGIEPLLANVDDFYNAIRIGQVDIQPGIISKSGETILKVDGVPVTSIETWAALPEDTQAIISKGEDVLTETIDKTQFSPTYLNRLVYFEDQNSIFYGKLQEGDVLTAVDGAQILEEADLLAAIKDKISFDISYFRPGVGMIETNVTQPAHYPVISYIEIGSPAEEVGLMVGDQVKMINDDQILSPENVVAATAKNKDSKIKYMVIRDSANLNFEIPLREDGRVGVSVAELIQGSEISFYSALVPHTLIEVHKVQYGFYAPVQAVKDMWRLGKLTAVMFVKVLGGFVSGGSVPDGVSGPVGIAQMTYVFLQDGFAAIIRFMALLSLSLGVVNILPIPALDGGRFLFILIQGMTGKKANPRIEGYIHSAGFVFLLLFIAYVTFNDVLRLF